MKAKSVLVIGAGIGGLTAAIHLARRGPYGTDMPTAMVSDQLVSERIIDDIRM